MDILDIKSRKNTYNRFSFKLSLLTEIVNQKGGGSQNLFSSRWTLNIPSNSLCYLTIYMYMYLSGVLTKFMFLGDNFLLYNRNHSQLYSICRNEVITTFKTKRKKYRSWYQFPRKTIICFSHKPSHIEKAAILLTWACKTKLGFLRCMFLLLKAFDFTQMC